MMILYGEIFDDWHLVVLTFFHINISNFVHNLCV
jgi:hypothetical protein